MRICFLSTKHPPFDKRVFAKEALSLAAAGHDVVHLAPATSESGESLEGVQGVHEGVEILTFKPPHGLLGRILHAPRIFRRAKRVGADCFHCNEVDSWVIGLMLKAVTGSKVVFDAHEHYSTQFADDHCPRFLRAPVGGLLRLMFRVLARFTDRLVLAKRGVASDFSGSRTEQVLVQNFASLAQSEPCPTRKAGGEDRPITAIHIGLFSRVRGWPQLLDALVTSPCRDLHVRVIGSFVDESRGDFERRSEELGLGDRIRIDDWMPYPDAYRELCAADVGLILFQPGMVNSVYALPHKLFDYMLAELPVIAPSFAVEVAEIVRDSDCGLLVESSEPEQIGTALGRLALDPGERRRLGRNGRRAVLDRYNWESESRRLQAMYREIEKQTGRLGTTPGS